MNYNKYLYLVLSITLIAIFSVSQVQAGWFDVIKQKTKKGVINAWGYMGSEKPKKAWKQAKNKSKESINAVYSKIQKKYEKMTIAQDFDYYEKKIKKCYKDKENQKRTIKAIKVVYALCRYVDVRDKKTLRDSVQSIGNIPMKTKNGKITTIEKHLSQIIISKVPFLEGTPIARQSMMIVLFTIVSPDTSRIISDLPMIQNPSTGEFISIKDALDGTSVDIPENTILSMEIMKEFKSLSSDDDVSFVEFVSRTGKIVENINKLNTNLGHKN